MSSFLAALAFLQRAIYVTVAANPSILFTPFVKGVEIAPYPGFVDTGPIIPNVTPESDAGLFKGGLGTDTKHLPYVQIPSDAEYKQSNSSERLQPSELSFKEWNSRVSKQEHRLQEYFAYTYVKKVKAYKKLRKIFQVQQHFDAKSLSSCFYKLVFEAHTSVGSLDAQVSAQVVSKAVAVNFDYLKRDSLLHITAEAGAKYLSFRDVLTSSNAASLSKKLFTLLKKSVNSVKNSTPEENLKAIATGYVDFLKSLGLYTPHSAAMFSGLFANELYSLGRKSHQNRQKFC